MPARHNLAALAHSIADPIHQDWVTPLLQLTWPDINTSTEELFRTHASLSPVGKILLGMEFAHNPAFLLKIHGAMAADAAYDKMMIRASVERITAAKTPASTMSSKKQNTAKILAELGQIKL